MNYFNLNQGLELFHHYCITSFGVLVPHCIQLRSFSFVSPVVVAFADLHISRMNYWPWWSVSECPSVVSSPVYIHFEIDINPTCEPQGLGWETSQYNKGKAPFLQSSDKRKQSVDVIAASVNHQTQCADVHMNKGQDLHQCVTEQMQMFHKSHWMVWWVWK